jgi:D-glycero-D-manno-heptose 1,7-bisphosphate phosphatase
MERAVQRCVVVGRDGVILRRLANGRVLSWREMEFLPRALDGLRLLANYGFGVLVVPNQECAEKGWLRPHEQQQVARRLMLEAALAGGRIDQLYHCVHAQVEACNCRSPQSGLLRRAVAEHALVAAETYVIGASAEEMEAAAVAGCPAILLRRDAFLDSGAAESGGSEASVGSLYEAAEIIVKRNGSNKGAESTKHWERLEPAHHTR